MHPQSNFLRSIQRVETPPQPFDPATSTRTFRIAVPAITALIAEVFARISEEAPGVALEWVWGHIFKRRSPMSESLLPY